MPTGGQAASVWKSGGAGRQALGEELDLHDFIAAERIGEKGLNRYFICRSVEIGKSIVYGGIDTFWSETDGFILPSTHYFVDCRSRRSYRYPWLNVRTTLPDTTRVGDESSLSWWMGFEGGPGQRGSLIALNHYSSDAGDNILRLAVGTRGARINLDVNDSWCKPGNWATVDRGWMIRIHRNLIVFSRDYIPKAFVVPTGHFWSFTIDGPPYAIGGIGQFPSALPAFVEWDADGRTSAPSQVAASGLKPSVFRCGDGVEIAPLNLPLYKYQESTWLAGMEVDPDVTSHPFPLFGFAGKTINFMADEAGTLTIEVFNVATENWREYDSISVVANALETYNMAGEEVLGRIVFTPDAPPATILEAEVNLR